MSSPPVLSIPPSHLLAHGRLVGGYGMERGVATGPERIPTSTGEDLSHPQVRVAELSPERICGALIISVPIPAVLTASSLDPARTRMGACQERISPQLHNQLQDTHTKKNKNKNRGKQEQNSSSENLPAHWSGCRHLPP